MCLPIHGGSVHILFAASECVPFSKTGGLADVVGALPHAIATLGHQVTVYLPLYRSTQGAVGVPSQFEPDSFPAEELRIQQTGEQASPMETRLADPPALDNSVPDALNAGGTNLDASGIDASHLVCAEPDPDEFEQAELSPARHEAPRTVIASLTIPFDDRYRFCSVIDGGMEHGVRYLFIDYPPFFDRDGLYGTSMGDFPDNAERFALYCRAVIESAKLLGVPDVIHCHDWQSALIPILLRTLYEEDPAWHNIPTIFTIHNMGYQGVFSPDTLPLLMLPWDLLTISKLEFFGNVNFLKGALVYSDFITTVSRRYAHEIQTAEYGYGLDGVLRGRASSVAGILNGVDYNEWNPATDRFLPAQYSPESLDGKRECRRELLRRFALDPESTAPVIGVVTRFAGQKGVGLIALAADRLAHEDCTLVILGSGERQYEDRFNSLARHYPGRIGLKIGYDNELAHLIEAGSDMFLMPSRYEPCGLNQIYSLKYGTVPIVRAVGGLDDTITAYDRRTGKGTGFKFHEYTPEALLAAVKSALAVFQKPEKWRGLMLSGMACDFSWEASAQAYVRIYEKVRAARHELPV
jgi:starch synthase